MSETPAGEHSAEKDAGFAVAAGACPDKACSATGPEACKYPNWMLCAHPVERPARTVTASAETAEGSSDE